MENNEKDDNFKIAEFLPTIQSFLFKSYNALNVGAERNQFVDNDGLDPFVLIDEEKKLNLSIENLWDEKKFVMMKTGDKCKTTFCRYLCDKWSNNEIWRENPIKYLFLVEMKEYIEQGYESLVEYILENYFDDSLESQQLKIAIFQHMKLNSEEIGWVIDDLHLAEKSVKIELLKKLDKFRVLLTINDDNDCIEEKSFGYSTLLLKRFDSSQVLSNLDSMLQNDSKKEEKKTKILNILNNIYFEHIPIIPLHLEAAFNLVNDYFDNSNFRYKDLIEKHSKMGDLIESMIENFLRKDIAKDNYRNLVRRVLEIIFYERIDSPQQYFKIQEIDSLVITELSSNLVDESRDIIVQKIQYFMKKFNSSVLFKCFFASSNIFRTLKSGDTQSFEFDDQWTLKENFYVPIFVAHRFKASPQLFIDFLFFFSQCKKLMSAQSIQYSLCLEEFFFVYSIGNMPMKYLDLKDISSHNKPLFFDRIFMYSKNINFLLSVFSKEEIKAQFSRHHNSLIEICKYYAEGLNLDKFKLLLSLGNLKF